MDTEHQQQRTVNDLDAIQGRADAASPAPWGWEHGYDMWPELHDASLNAFAGICHDNASDQRREEADATFIVAARQDVPALVAEVRELRAENERVRGQRDDFMARVKRHQDSEDARVERGERLLTAVEIVLEGGTPPPDTLSNEIVGYAVEAMARLERALELVRAASEEHTERDPDLGRCWACHEPWPCAFAREAEALLAEQQAAHPEPVDPLKARP